LLSNVKEIKSTDDASEINKTQIVKLVIPTNETIGMLELFAIHRALKEKPKQKFGVFNGTKDGINYSNDTKHDELLLANVHSLSKPSLHDRQTVCTFMTNPSWGTKFLKPSANYKLYLPTGDNAILTKIGDVEICNGNKDSVTAFCKSKFDKIDLSAYQDEQIGLSAKFHQMAGLTLYFVLNADNSYTSVGIEPDVLAEKYVKSRFVEELSNSLHIVSGCSLLCLMASIGVVLKIST